MAENFESQVTSTTSGNATKGRALKRMKLVFNGTEVKFAVNPEEYTQSEPNKATITQTKGGAWIDAWGAGIVEISIKGTTGVRGTGTSIDTGYNRWKELRGLIRKVYESVDDGQEITDDLLIKFYNYTDNEYYYCYPAQSGIELYRSKSRPHIYQYNIHLWGLRRIGQPKQSVGTIGNPNKKGSSGSSTQTTKNSKTSTSGGPQVYTTRNSVTESEADKVIVTNTKTKTILGLQEDAYEYLTALEPLIGGKAGKISPITGFQCVQGITIQSSGTISNVTPFDGYELIDVNETDLLLAEVKFISRVSVETYDMVEKIKDYSPDVLSPAYCPLVVGLTNKQKVISAIANSQQYDSTIYVLLEDYVKRSILSKTEVNRIKIILLETMMIYRELYRIYDSNEESLSTTVTMTNIEILLRNIRSVILYFDVTSTDLNKYDRMEISHELRELEKILTQVRTDIIDYL